ncbi:MAG: hypothetical protein JSS09_03980 [Verrucomicrobia bacterium]|nr:hypothetical protein [Verrucomicrobiota bacterium]
MNYKIVPFIFLSYVSLSPLAAVETPAQTPSVTTQPKGVITPTVAPKVQNGLGLIIDADFTWWKSQISGMGFATIDSRVQSPHSDFQPGFKVGLGLDLDFDGWDTYAEYTWFKSPWATTSKDSKDEVSYSSFIHTNSSTGALSSMILADVTSSRKEQFNILDLELARNFFISKRLTLRPHFGVKLARMLEKTSLIERQEGLTGFVKVFLSQTLSGIGTRAGINTVWHLSRTFGLYGDLALSALWSSIHNYCDTYFSDDHIQTDTRNTNKTQTILPVFEMGIGLTYMTWFYNEKYQIYAKAGWEEQIWLNYNYNMPNGVVNNTGNLTLQGLTAKVGFAF